MKRILLMTLVVLVIPALVVGYFGIWEWGICRNYCDVGRSLRLTRKTGVPAPNDAFAGPGQMGVVEQMLGPGRHFVNPWDYDVVSVADTVIPAGKIGVVMSRVGRDLPPDRYLAGPGEKGIQRAVLTPGTWRVNTHGASVDVVDSVHVPAGYVGVQTMLAGANKGVLPNVLQPGTYNLNPKQLKVEIVEIGYRELSVKTDLDPRGSPVEGTGVSFPTKDGFRMFMDITVIWGVMPENAPRVIREYGQVDEVEQKIIVPQLDSVCKLQGSRDTVRQFIVGQDREAFQKALNDDLSRVGKEKGLDILLVLVRGIYPPKEVLEPIQQARLADEERQTLEVRKDTDAEAAKLEEAKKKVEIMTRDFTAETTKLVETERAEGAKKAANLEAETERLVADIAAQTATIEAERTKLLGQAEADVVEAKRRAEADRFQRYVKAYGDGATYNIAKFAENLPENLEIEFRYSGAGTFWTDAGNGGQRVDLDDAATKLLLEFLQSRKTAPPAEKKP